MKAQWTTAPPEREGRYLYSDGDQNIRFVDYFYEGADYVYWPMYGYESKLSGFHGLRSVEPIEPPDEAALKALAATWSEDVG